MAAIQLMVGTHTPSLHHFGYTWRSGDDNSDSSNRLVTAAVRSPRLVR
jgi:hypothetical protein